MVHVPEPHFPDTPLGSNVTHLQSLLRASPYWAVRQLVCELNRNRIVLRGTVPSYYLKQVAQSVALQAARPGQIESDVEVRVAENGW